MKILNQNLPLTMEQKKIIILTNYAIGLYCNKINEDDYNNSPAFSILSKWITEIIGVDYRKDVYDNKDIVEINRIDSIKKEISKKYGSWFIGDVLSNSLYQLCFHNVQDEQQILAKEQEIKDTWNYFKSLLPKPKENFQYVPVEGIQFNGLQLYQKIEVI